MELPKNITQIGETNPHCKVYVEDYVISYIKQLNQYAGEKEMAVGLYGVRKEEAGITYLFLYGACRLVFLQKECRHLSQAVLQEAEKQRRKFFPETIFLGYRMLDGEMVEGFHICEQGVCRYVEGYAQFYEKNDAMLAFMLEERQEASKPEVFDQEKYNVVKKRQEERRSQAEEKGGHAILPKRKPARETAPAPANARKMRGMKLTAAAVFALLCATGLMAMGDGERLNEWQMALRQLMENMSEQQLPDMVQVSNGTAQVGTIVAEDKLTDAILHENGTANAEGTGQGQASHGSVTADSGHNPSGSAAQGQASAQDPGQTSADETAGQGQTQPSVEGSGQGQPDGQEAAQPGDQGAAQNPNQPGNQGTAQNPNQPGNQGAAQNPNQPGNQGAAQNPNQLGNQGTAQDSNQSDGQGAAQNPDQPGHQGTEQSSDQSGSQATEQGQSGSSGETQSQEQPDSQETAQNPEESAGSQPAAGPVKEMIAYTVQKGDTLTGICVKRYGSDARVSEICSLNKIENPDDIKVGEKIFLPQ